MIKTTQLSASAQSVHMADTDRRAFVWNALEAVTTATASLTRLDTKVSVSGPIETVTSAGNVVTVTVSALTRGLVYELAVTFTAQDGLRWTSTLVIECVA
ncbi:MAG: hypothetical protein M3Q75_07340 [Gemmatimonadota bacterium]|nr:hypothetical protein [Gemmatimonadota bacterium]